MRHLSKKTFELVYQEFKKKKIDSVELVLLEILKCYYLTPEIFDRISIATNKIMVNDGMGVGSIEYAGSKGLLERVNLFLTGHKIPLDNVSPSLFQPNGRRLAELILGDGPKGDWEEVFQSQSVKLLKNFWAVFYDRYRASNRSNLEEIRATPRPGFNL